MFSHEDIFRFLKAKGCEISPEQKVRTHTREIFVVNIKMLDSKGDCTKPYPIIRRGPVNWPNLPISAPMINSLLDHFQIPIHDLLKYEVDNNKKERIIVATKLLLEIDGEFLFTDVSTLLLAVEKIRQKNILDSIQLRLVNAGHSVISHLIQFINDHSNASAVKIAEETLVKIGETGEYSKLHVTRALEKLASDKKGKAIANRIRKKIST